MGVPGLWDLLRPSATRTSLSTLAREAFYSNKNGLRALTIGIDASIWIFHAQIPQYGENPFMRTIFFKITLLLQHPVLPVFVFDGPNKPSRKRGERVAGQFGTSDYRSKQFKELLDACGLEWWNAPGEAEAELAVMSRQGKIDAVLSDDVDALLFGATCLLRNNSPTLSGAQASSTQGNSAKSDLRHYEMYRSSSIVKQWTEREGTALSTEEDCRMAMVWIALLGGGDYAPEGLAGFGPTITYALANAGMADFLRRYKVGHPIDEIDIAKVHSQMIDELRTNASGHLGRRYPARAAELQTKDPLTLFPAFALDAYLRPATSPLDDRSAGWPGFGKGEAEYRKRGKAREEGRGDLEGFARACERFFEWGTKDLVAKKFGSESVGLFGSEIVTCARERIRLSDPKLPSSRVGSQANDLEGGSRMTSFFRSTSTPTRSRPRTSFTKLPPHVIKIHSVRQDPTNVELREYRVGFTTSAYIERCHAVMDGHRVDPKQLDASERVNLGLVEKDVPEAEPTQASAGTSKTEARLWIAEYLVQEAWPELVKAYEDELAAKAKPKTKAKAKAPARGKGKATGGENAAAFKSFFTQSHRPTVAATQTQTQRNSRASSPEEEEEEFEYPASSSSLSSAPSRSSNREPEPIFLSSSPVRSSSRRSSTLTPPPPSSPLPTIDRIKQNVRRAPPSSSSGSASAPSHSARVPSPPAVAGKSRTTPAPPARTSTRRNTRSAKQAKQTPAVIDLCSTDEEAESAPAAPSPARRSKSATPRRVLGPTSKTNTPPPAVLVDNNPKGSQATKANRSKGKGRDKDNHPSSQSILALPVIRPSTSSSLSLGKPPSSPAAIPKDVVGPRAKSREKEKAPLFLVTYEDDEVVEIDVRGRWARGESVGPWEDLGP